MDLEWNTTYSHKRKGFFNEIIEIGAVKLDQNLVLKDRYQQFVCTQVSKKLTGHVKQMTGINMDDLAGGKPLMQALVGFRKWIGPADTVILTWSATDLMVLLDNLKYFSGRGTHIPFMRRYVDLQRLCDVAMAAQKQTGLKVMADMLEIDSSDLDAHRAVDDCLLCARIFERLYDETALQKAIQITDKHFYRRLFFKPYFLSKKSSRLIPKGSFDFDCPVCSCPAQPLEEFQFKNHAFFARFSCGDCQQDFIGQLKAKKTYDEVKILKRTLPIKAPEPEEEPETKT